MTRFTAPRRLAIAALAALVALPAWSQATSSGSALDSMAGMFKPSDHDLTLAVLVLIFGDWSGSSKVSFLGEAMSYYNSSVMLFGVLLYTVLGTIGVVQTAKDGVLLGKKMSSTWIPIRFVAAMAMLIPLASGYSRIQSYALNGAVLGGGAASKVWSMVSSSVVEPVGSIGQGDQAFKLADSTIPGGASMSIARGVFASLVCMHHHNQGLQAIQSSVGADGSPASGSPLGPYSFYQTRETAVGAYTDTVRFGSASNAKPECGKYSSSTIKDDVPPPASTASPEWTPITNAFADPANSFTPKMSALADLAARQSSAIMQVAQLLSPSAAKQATSDGSTDSGSLVVSSHLTSAQVEAQLKQAAALYDQAMGPAVRAYGDANSKDYKSYVEATTKYGWMMAGASIYRISAVRGQISSAISTAISPNVTEGSDMTASDGDTVAGLSSDAADIQALTQAVASDHNFIGNAMIQTAGVIGRAITVDPSSPTHAIIQVKDSGDRLVNTGTTLFALGAAAQAAGAITDSNPLTGFAAKFTGLSTLLSGSAIALYSLGGALLLCGFTMAYIIPLLPFITSIGNIVGWMMATYSAVIAVPVWMAAHFHPNGDELVGRGAGGYMILIESIFRPLFLVFGLVGGYKIADVAIRLFTFLVPVAISGVQVSTATGVVTLLFTVGFHVVTVLGICRTCMKFSESLQNKVMTWIGGAHAGYDAGSEMAHGIERSTNGFQGNAGRAYGAFSKHMGETRDARVKAGAAAASAEGQGDKASNEAAVSGSTSKAKNGDVAG